MKLQLNMMSTTNTLASTAQSASTNVINPVMKIVCDFARLAVNNIPTIVGGLIKVAAGAFYNALDSYFIVLKTQIKVLDLVNVAGYCANRVSEQIVPLLGLYALSILWRRYNKEITNTLTYRDDIPIVQPGPPVPVVPNQNAMVVHQVNAAPMAIPTHLDVHIAGLERDRYYDQWRADTTYQVAAFYGNKDIAKDDLDRALTVIKHARIRSEYIPSAPLPVGSIIRINANSYFIVRQQVYLQDERPLSDRVVDFSSGLVYKLELRVKTYDYIRSWTPWFLHFYIDRMTMGALGFDRKHFFINHELLLKSRRFLISGSNPTTILVEKDLSVNSSHLPLLQYGVYLNRDSAFVLRTMHSGSLESKYETFQ
jgi:hypothetical protein